MLQTYTSKRTAKIRKKAPSVYTKIKFNLIPYEAWRKLEILDYGTGRSKTSIRNYVFDKIKSYHLSCYDPYWVLYEDNKKALSCHPHLVVISEVFNVIKEDEVIKDIVTRCLSYNVPIFITVGEGDKSGIGKATDDGWQRNQRLKDYLPIVNSTVFSGFSIVNGVITNSPDFLRKRGEKED